MFQTVKRQNSWCSLLKFANLLNITPDILHSITKGLKCPFYYLFFRPLCYFALAWFVGLGVLGMGEGWAKFCVHLIQG